MTFRYKPAHRENEPVRLGLAGPSRSGKTKSALRIASGMVGGDNSKIFGIDTERGGLKNYADDFPGFMVTPLTPPFSPERYLEAMRDAGAAGAQVVIVDSASHEHSGEGGILDSFEVELARMAGDDYGKREAMKFAAWIKPKMRHEKFVQSILLLPFHQIYCFRAKEKLKMVRNPKGKMEPVSQGYQPIITDGFEYEMHSLILLGENSKGVPDLTAQATGLRAPVDRFLEEAKGRSLDEEFGRKLAAWARGGAQAKGGGASGPQLSEPLRDMTPQQPASDTVAGADISAAPPQDGAVIETEGDWPAVVEEIWSAVAAKSIPLQVMATWETFADRRRELNAGAPALYADLFAKVQAHLKHCKGKTA